MCFFCPCLTICFIPRLSRSSDGSVSRKWTPQIYATFLSNPADMFALIVRPAWSLTFPVSFWTPSVLLLPASSLLACRSAFLSSSWRVRRRASEPGCRLYSLSFLWNLNFEFLAEELGPLVNRHQNASYVFLSYNLDRMSFIGASAFFLQSPIPFKGANTLSLSPNVSCHAGSNQNTTNELNATSDNSCQVSVSKHRVWSGKWI
jgi:hypothetical protein